MIGNLYASLTKTKSNELIPTYNTELSNLITALLSQKNNIYDYLEFNYKKLKEEIKIEDKDLKFFPAILMEIGLSNLDISNIVRRIYEQEFPKQTKEVHDSVTDALYLIFLTKALVEKDTKEEALEKAGKFYISFEDLTLDTKEAISIFKESSSFKDCLERVEGKPSHIKAIALNLSETFYDYIDPSFISKLFKELDKSKSKNLAFEYFKRKYIYYNTRGQLNFKSPILFYHDLTSDDHSNDKILSGKNINQLFYLYLFKILNKTVEYEDTNNSKYQKVFKLFDINSYFNLVLTQDFTKYPKYKDYVKELKQNIKAYDSNQTFTFFNEHIIKLSNNILKEKYVGNKELILFNDLSSFMEYINKINYDGDLFNIA